MSGLRGFTSARSISGATVPALMPIAKGRKNSGGSWFNVAHNTTSGVAKNPVNDMFKGENHGWFNDAKRKGGSQTGRLSRSGSKSPARKAASAMIAKIPLVLSRHIAQAWKPEIAA